MTVVFFFLFFFRMTTAQAESGSVSATYLKHVSEQFPGLHNIALAKRLRHFRTGQLFIRFYSHAVNPFSRDNATPSSEGQNANSWKEKKKIGSNLSKLFILPQTPS